MHLCYTLVRLYTLKQKRPLDRQDSHHWLATMTAYSYPAK